MFNFLKRLWRIITAPKPSPIPQQPSPKPEPCIADQLCDDHSRDFEDPAKPEVSDWTPASFRQGYIDNWITMEWPVYRKGVNGTQQASTLSWTMTRIRSNAERYKKCSEYVFNKLGRRYPWELLAVLHMREAGGDFKKNMMNGQPLTMKTTWVPKGYGPWATWEDSVVDAFRIKKMPDKWTIANTLHFCQTFNGLGYTTAARAKIVGGSPYLYAFSNIYKIGYFISDGKFSDKHVALGVGVAVMLKELGYKGE
jgi:lysozyme family protein